MYMPISAPTEFHASTKNGGWYVVNSATSGLGAGASKIYLTRLSNGAPQSFSAKTVAAITNLVFIRPAIDGTGKSMTIKNDSTGDLPIVDVLFTTAGAAVSWLSK